MWQAQLIAVGCILFQVHIAIEYYICILLYTVMSRSRHICTRLMNYSNTNADVKVNKEVRAVAANGRVPADTAMMLVESCRDVDKLLTAASG